MRGVTTWTFLHLYNCLITSICLGTKLEKKTREWMNFISFLINYLKKEDIFLSQSMKFPFHLDLYSNFSTKFNSCSLKEKVQYIRYWKQTTQGNLKNPNYKRKSQTIHLEIRIFCDPLLRLHGGHEDPPEKSIFV